MTKDIMQIFVNEVLLFQDKGDCFDHIKVIKAIESTIKKLGYKFSVKWEGKKINEIYFEQMYITIYEK